MNELLEKLGLALANAQTEEEYNSILLEMQKMGKETLGEIQKVVLRKQVQEGVTVEAFLAFYQLLYGFKLPPHMEEAIRKTWKAHDEGVPFVLLGARGFWKTVTYVTLDAFLIGHNFHMTGIVTGANDPNCIIIAKQIANIIEFNPEWKQCFPHVIPKEKAWGAEGYWVRDGRISREEWEQKQAGTIDPTFVGGGYKSSSINGKHPSLFLHVDDLHDIDSWKSELERVNIKEVYMGQISKTMIYNKDKLVTWNYLLGVPFSKEDTLNSIIASGVCVSHVIPCMVKAPEGEGVYIDGVNPHNGVTYDDIRGWWYLTAPDRFGTVSVINKRAEGKFAFWQMYMMDIETARTAGIKYHLYPHEKIEFDLPMVGGADPSTFQEAKDGDSSSFAHVILAKLPNNTAVVVDVILKKCTLTEAKDIIVMAQDRYPNLRYTGVENVGPGKVFYEYLLTDPRVKVVKSDLSGLGSSVRNKSDRQKTQVSGWLENMTVLISNNDTPGLKSLRKLYDNFPDVPKHDEAWDAGDALYHAMKLIPEVLRLPTPKEDIKPAAYINTLQSAWSRI